MDLKEIGPGSYTKQPNDLKKAPVFSMGEKLITL